MDAIKYDRHDAEWENCLTDENRKRQADTWLRNDTLDSWRHERMHKVLLPVIRSDLNAHWLTVGDGRFGTDAHYLLSQGVARVHASDISETLLRVGKQRGFITEYSAQNCERLTFEDNAFDYVHCKEAFHHFPRPWIAVYEMFRVARKAVVLQEPRDQVVHRRWFKTLVKSILRRPDSGHAFEPVGNYIYSLSEREVEKFLLGMHYSNCAFAGVNDYYVEGTEFCPLEGGTSKQRSLRRNVKGRIILYDILQRLRLSESCVLTAILFKAQPDKALLESLRQAGWKVNSLPVNPYMNA